MTRDEATRDETTTDEAPAPATPLLEIQDLAVHYRTVRGEARAVDGVSLTVHRGEILGIAGESGCGKSTLAAAILRLTRPPGFLAGGRVLFRPATGEPMDLLQLNDDRLRSVRWRYLSYVPQGSMNSLNPVTRVSDQFVDAMVQHAPMSQAQANVRVPELLHQVGLGAHVARMFPHELSGGMKQRVIIAMAIALNPDLVIADEPTTALDVNVQRVIIQTLAELRERLGMSLIVVTHDMAVHAQLADRVAVMYAGKIVEHAAVRDVFKRPRHPYAQGLIRSIPVIGGAHRRLTGIDGIAPSPLAWPPGCRFHTRCPHVMPVCRSEVPALLPLLPLEQETRADQHADQTYVACHLYPQVGQQRLPEPLPEGAPQRTPERTVEGTPEWAAERASDGR